MTPLWEGVVCGIAGTLAVQFVAILVTVWWASWWMGTHEDRFEKAMHTRDE